MPPLLRLAGATAAHERPFPPRPGRGDRPPPSRGAMRGGPKAAPVIPGGITR